MRRSASIALAALLLAACGTPAEPGAHGSAPTTAPAGTRPLPTWAHQPESAATSSTGAVTGEVPAALLALARRDLAERTGLDSESLSVVGAEALTWPDGSLGCPQPGESYLAAPTPGYRVILQAAGALYDYRLSAAGHLVLCAGTPAG